ncbi:Alanine dehydrogenase [termite gut metagenome]|uniref:alanine dehydrogenase n=1 Tax=termite gut metagenome TaxID=433724 RepID=A0A5J4R8H0_9ZZZZ
MIIGVLKEIKLAEKRVCMTSAGVDAMVKHSHQVLVETDAGVGSGFSNEAYKEVGAELVATPKEIFKRADMVMHVKEIQSGEYALLREGQIVFTYLHLAADPEQTAALQASKCVAIAYETVQTADKRLPLLQPMSEVAGRMAIQEGARFLEMPQGGNGVLLGGVPGVAPAKVVILGGGVVGTNAAKIACGMGADVTVLDMNLDRLRYLDDIMPANCKVIMSNPYVIQEEIKQADLVIGAVLVAGAKAPKLVTKEMIAKMKKGAVMVDVAIDQGGCFETSKPTTHQDPVFTVEGVIQYCVANMPGAVARTSTLALTNATLPYALAIADKGWKKALEEDKALALGLNVVGGEIVFAPVKEALGLV